MPEEDIQNYKRCIRKNIEVHPVHGRDIKGKLIQVDTRLKIIYIEKDDAIVQIPLKRVSTTYWPKGFVPKISNSEDTGEYPRDEKGNHIRPFGSKRETRSTQACFCQEHKLKFRSKKEYKEHLQREHKEQGSESQASTVNQAIQDSQKPNIYEQNEYRV